MTPLDTLLALGLFLGLMLGAFVVMAGVFYAIKR